MSSRLMWRGAAIAILAMALTSCNGDDNGPSGPPASIQLAVAPSSLTLQQGTSGTVTVTLTRGGNFAGAVSIALEGLPAGLTAASVPATLTGTATSATITVTAAASVVPGTYTVTVRASATGVTDATTTLALTVTATPNVTLAVAPAALTIAQGATGAATVTLTRTNFTGAVALTLDAPPAGVAGTFTPASVTADNSALAVQVSPTVAVGSYTLTIKGTATGVGDRTTTLALTVIAPPATIAITIAPVATSVAQNGAGEAFVTITRTNFNGPVALAATGMPAGVTVAFDQTPTLLSQVRMTYSATAAAPVGTYTITVTGQAAGLTTATATLSLQVIAAAANAIEFQFCSASENPVFFAARDGSGAWQVVTGTLSANVYRYRFTLSQAVGGVFYVQQSGSAMVAGRSLGTLGTLLRPGQLTTTIFPDALARLQPAALASATAATAATAYESTAYFATATELASIGLDNCVATQATKSVWLQVTGVGNSQQATLSLGGVTEFFDGLMSLSPVQFTGVRSGVIDFFGVRSATLTGVPNKILDVRGLNPADGSTLPFTADFNSTSAYDPASAQLSIGNALGDDILNFTTFHTVNGDGGMLGGAFAPSTATTRLWYGVPSAKLQAGDVHANVIFASPAVTPTDEQRYHFLFTTAVQSVAQVLGARLPTQTVTTATASGYRRIRVQGTLPAEYNDLVTVQYQSSGGGNEVWMIATGAYLTATGSAAAYDLTTPDVGALAGFPIASEPPPGAWEVLVNVNGWSGIGTLNPVPANGATFLGAAKQVPVTMP